MNLNPKAIFLDLSGVLYDGTQVIEGSVEAVRRLREKGLVLRFVTNTVSKNSSQILEQLSTLGFLIHESELFTAPIAAREYIKRNQLTPFCLIPDSIRDDFVSAKPEVANCVLLGDAQQALNYDNLNQAFQILQNGGSLIALGKNKYFKNESGLQLDAGAFVHGLEWAACVKATIMGKPGKDFFKQVVESTNYNPEDCLMVGDDVLGDVVGAVEAGLKGALVKTGKYQLSDENLLPEDSMAFDNLLMLAKHICLK